MLSGTKELGLITYSRKPTASEIKFGYGATHYLDVLVINCSKKDGTIKKRIKHIDGLIYTQNYAY